MGLRAALTFLATVPLALPRAAAAHDLSVARGPPPGEIPLALLFSNGAKIGQLMFAATFLALASRASPAADRLATRVGAIVRVCYWHGRRILVHRAHERDHRGLLKMDGEHHMMDTPRAGQRADLTRRWHAAWLVAAAAILFPDLALAHQGGVAGGLASGFAHPILGPDHLVAMVAVGLWGAFVGHPAIWLLPVVFPVVMAFGGLLGINGVPMPAVEMGIAASALALGAMVALALRPPLWVAAVLVGAFAIFHGHAHGTELPQAANPLAYGVGFLVATGLLHLFGIALGLLARWPGGVRAVRVGGGAIACAGLYFLTGA